MGGGPDAVHKLFVRPGGGPPVAGELPLHELTEQLADLGLEGVREEELRGLLRSHGASSDAYVTEAELSAIVGQSSFAAAVRGILTRGAALLRRRGRGLREALLAAAGRSGELADEEDASVPPGALRSVLVDQLGFPLTGEQLAALLAFADLDGNGRADVAEVLALAGEEGDEESGLRQVSLGAGIDTAAGGLAADWGVASGSESERGAAEVGAAEEGEEDPFLYEVVDGEGGVDEDGSMLSAAEVWTSDASSTAPVLAPYEPQALLAWYSLDAAAAAVASAGAACGTNYAAAVQARHDAVARGSSRLPCTLWSACIVPAVFRALAAAGRVPTSLSAAGVPSTASSGGGPPTCIMGEPRELLRSAAAAAPAPGAATAAAAAAAPLGPLAMDARRLGAALAVLGVPQSAAAAALLARRHDRSGAGMLDAHAFAAAVDEVAVAAFDAGTLALQPLAEARIRTALRSASACESAAPPSAGAGLLAAGSRATGPAASTRGSACVSRAALALALHDSLRLAGLSLLEAAAVAAFVPGPHQGAAAAAIAASLAAAADTHSAAADGSIVGVDSPDAPASPARAGAAGAGGGAAGAGWSMRQSSVSVVSAFPVGAARGRPAAAAVPTPSRKGEAAADATARSPAAIGAEGGGRGAAAATALSPQDASELAGTLLQALQEACPSPDVSADGVCAWLRCLALCGACIDAVTTVGGAASPSSPSGASSLEVLRCPASLLSSPAGRALLRHQQWYTALPPLVRGAARKLCSLTLALPAPAVSCLLLPSQHASPSVQLLSAQPAACLVAAAPLTSLLVHSPRLPVSFHPSRLAPLAGTSAAVGALGPWLLDAGVEADPGNLRALAEVASVSGGAASPFAAPGVPPSPRSAAAADGGLGVSLRYASLLRAGAPLAGASGRASPLSGGGARGRSSSPSGGAGSSPRADAAEATQLRPIGAAASDADAVWAAEGALARPGGLLSVATAVASLKGATGVPLPADDALRSLVVGRLARVALVQVWPASEGGAGDAAGAAGTRAVGTPTATPAVAADAGGADSSAYAAAYAGRMRLLSSSVACPAGWAAAAEEEWNFAAPGASGAADSPRPGSASPASRSATATLKPSRLALRCDAPRLQGAAGACRAPAGASWAASPFASVYLLVELNVVLAHPALGAALAAGSASATAHVAAASASAAAVLQPLLPGTGAAVPAASGALPGDSYGAAAGFGGDVAGLPPVEEVTCAWGLVPLPQLLEASAGAGSSAPMRVRLTGGSPGAPCDITPGDIYQRRTQWRSLAKAFAAPRSCPELSLSVKPLSALGPADRQALGSLPLTALIPYRQVRLVAALRRLLARSLLGRPLPSHLPTAAHRGRDWAPALALRLLSDVPAAAPNAASALGSSAAVLAAAVDAEAGGGAAPALKAGTESTLADMLTRCLPAVAHSGLGLGVAGDAAGSGTGGASGSSHAMGLGAGRGSLSLLTAATSAPALSLSGVGAVDAAAAVASALPQVLTRWAHTGSAADGAKVQPANPAAVLLAPDMLYAPMGGPQETVF